MSTTHLLTRFLPPAVNWKASTQGVSYAGRTVKSNLYKRPQTPESVSVTIAFHFKTPVRSQGWVSTPVEKRLGF